MPNRRIRVVAIVLALIGAGLAGWYLVDRTGMLEGMCKVGLPNQTRPPEIKAEDLGCTILGPEQTYTGVLISGFEASNFSSEQFASLPDDQGRDAKISWFVCPLDGCGDALEHQLGRNPFPNCESEETRLGRTGMASVTVVGRVSLSREGYGHLGTYPREFFASKILAVAPPPAELVAEWEWAKRQRGFCDIPAKQAR